MDEGVGEILLFFGAVSSSKDLQPSLVCSIIKNNANFYYEVEK